MSVNYLTIVTGESFTGTIKTMDDFAMGNKHVLSYSSGYSSRVFKCNDEFHQFAKVGDEVTEINFNKVMDDGVVVIDPQGNITVQSKEEALESLKHRGQSGATAFRIEITSCDALANLATT